MDDIRLDHPIENNYFYNNEYGIKVIGIHNHTDVINNLFEQTGDTAIFAAIYSGEVRGSKCVQYFNSDIAIQNNTCDGQEFGIYMDGPVEPDYAGRVAITNNIVSRSNSYGLFGYGYFYPLIACNGYYDNTFNSNWGELEYNPVYEANFPYVDGPDGAYYLRQDCNFINNGCEYIEQTSLIGKTTDAEGLPDSNWVDLGFHYPGWGYSNAGVLRWDLSQDDIVNFFDFAVFANAWPATYDNLDLFDFVADWLKTESINPPIAVTILGDPNNLTGKVDIGISGSPPETTQGFIYIDGELKGEIDYRLDPETTDEYVSLDTMTLRNGQHDIKAVTIDSNGLVTVSPKISVYTNNLIYNLVRDSQFEQDKDYHIYAVSNCPNDFRVKLYDWNGNLAWTSGTFSWTMNLTIPAGIFTDEIYDVSVEAKNDTNNWEDIWNEAIGKKYDENGDYKVQVYLPRGGILSPSRDSRKQAVAELVSRSKARGFSCAVWYAGKANWKIFSTQVRKTSTQHVYIVAHGGRSYKGVSRRLFLLSSDGIIGTDYVFSHKDGIPGTDTDTSIHSIRELDLTQTNHLKIIYITACYQGDNDEMAREWIKIESALDQIFVSFEGLTKEGDPDWQLWDYQVWNQWCDGQTTWQEVFDYCSSPLHNPKGNQISAQIKSYGYYQTKFN